MSYEGFLDEICNRYDLQCHQHSLKVMFAPKFSGDMLMPITYQYQLEGFFNGLETGLSNPAIKVLVGCNSEAWLERVDSIAVVGSNNVKVATCNIPKYGQGLN